MRRAAFLLYFLLSASLLHAEATLQDWWGTYSLNQDGHMATLKINGVKCGNRPNCPPFFMRYIDDQGVTSTVVPGTFDDDGQHLQFTVEFANNPQVFDLYLFSFDKTHLAGTTVWGGRTFGVDAVKASSVQGGAPAQPAQTQSSGSGFPTIDSKGTTSIREADGSIRSKGVGDCGWLTTYPDGHTMKGRCRQQKSTEVQPLTPPDPPTSSQLEWLSMVDAQSLDIVQSMLGGAQTPSYQNYVSTHENPSADIYSRVSRRLDYIDSISYQ